MQNGALSGDRAAHRMPDQDRVGQVQGIHEGDQQAHVVRVAIAVRRFLREPRATIVERQHAETRSLDGGAVLRHAYIDAPRPWRKITGVPRPESM